MPEGWAAPGCFDVSASERGKRLDRPGLRSILDRLDEIDAIVVMRLDRLARSVADSAWILDQCAQHDVALIATEDGLDLDSMTGRLVTEILFVFAEFEARLTRERTITGKAKIIDQGKWVGGILPYGYRANDEGFLEVDSDESQILHQTAELILGGQSQLAVVRFLNDSDLTPRRAKHWSPRTIRRVLTGRHAAGPRDRES